MIRVQKKRVQQSSYYEVRRQAEERRMKAQTYQAVCPGNYEQRRPA
jgi:hypothetical protein